MKADQWAGLVTKASPYIIPVGAAVEQVNLSPAIPGQLTTRDGMRRIIGLTDFTNIIDCYAFDFGGRSVIVALRTNGDLVAIESPAYAAEPAMPVEPIFGIQSDQIGATYTNRFVQGPASETLPPAPAASPYVSELTGQSASVSTPTYMVRAGDTVTGNTASIYDGGTASTPEFNPEITTTQLPALALPGAPTITGVSQGVINWTTPSDGGSPLLYYKLYINGVWTEPDGDPLEVGWTTQSYDAYNAGLVARVSAGNGIGEGPLSAPFTVT